MFNQYYFMDCVLMKETDIKCFSSVPVPLRKINTVQLNFILEQMCIMTFILLFFRKCNCHIPKTNALFCLFLTCYKLCYLLVFFALSLFEFLKIIIWPNHFSGVGQLSKYV